jgi:CHAT domain-containing protein/Flp pilus assembly protein TadD/TolB-like protein
MTCSVKQTFHVIRWGVAAILLAGICISCVTFVLGEQIQSKHTLQLDSEEAVALSYMITKSAATAIYLARSYAVVAEERQAELASQIGNEILSIRALLATIEQAGRYPAFPKGQLDEPLSSASFALQDERVDITRIEGEIQLFLSRVVAWVQSDETDIEFAVGLSLGLALPSLIKEIDSLLLAPGSREPRFSEPAELLDRTALVLDTYKFALPIAPTLGLLAQSLRADSFTDEILRDIQTDLRDVGTFLIATSSFVLARGTALRSQEELLSSESLDQARILVLPCELVGHSVEHEWLTMGLANELAGLARLSGIFKETLLPMEYAPALLQFPLDSSDWNELAGVLYASHVLASCYEIRNGTIAISWELIEVQQRRTVTRGEVDYPLSECHLVPYRFLQAIGARIGQPVGDLPVITSPEAFEANARGVTAWLKLFSDPGAAVDQLYQSISFFAQALQVEPDYIQAIYNLGLVYLRIDDERALEQFYKALSAFGLVNMNLLTGAVNAMEGDEQVRLALTMDAEEPPPLKMEAAAQSYRAAIALDPHNSYHHVHLASVLTHLHRPEDAVASAQYAVFMFQHDGALYELLGNILFSLAASDSSYRPTAVQAMEEAIRIGPLDCTVRRSKFIGCLPREFYMAELAAAYADWRDWEPALEWAGKAVVGRTKLSSQMEDTVRVTINNRVAQQARELGREAMNNGDLRQAQQLFQYALEAARILDDKERMSVEWGEIALVHRRLGELEQARQSYLMAYELTNRASQQVILLHNLAVLHTMLGDPVNAEDALTQAEGILPRVSPSDATKLQAMVWAYRAQLAFDRGEISVAFRMLDQAIDTTPDQDFMFRYRVYKAMMLERVGLIEESLAIMAELSEDIYSVTDQGVIGFFARQMLGLARYGATPPQDLLTVAIQYTNDTAAKVDLYRTLAAVLDGQGRHAEAEVVLGTALSVAPPGQQALVRGELGFHFLLTQEYSQALEEFQHALWEISFSAPSEDERWPNPKLEEILLPAVGIEALWGKSSALQGLAKEGGSAASKQALYEEAWLCFDTALALLDQVRTGAREERYAASITGRTYSHLFEGAISHIVEMSDLFPESVTVERSFYIAEQAKARSTADSLFNFDRNPFALVLDNIDLVSALQSLNAKIDELTAQLSAEKSKPEEQQTLILVDTLTNELSQARRDFQSLWEEVLGTKTAAFISVDIEEITSNVVETLEFLEPNEAVLEYMVTEKGVYLWVIRASEQADLHEIGEPIFVSYAEEQLMNDVIALRQAIEDKNPDAITVNELLNSFYDKLVKEGLAKLPDGVDTLILIPSGPLWYLPFSALRMTDQPEREGQGTRCPYLIEKFTVAYLPSLATLPLLLESEEIAVGPSLLALADPKLSPEREGLSRYDNLEEACRDFARCLVGRETGVYAGESAQEERAYREAAGRQVVVYACHGEFDPYVPLQSKLFLAPLLRSGNEEDNSRLADGDYHAWETFLTDHKGAELVILAACETLLPAFHQLQGTMAVLSGQESEEIELTLGQLKQIITGDEVVGLARAFLSSGAEAVMGTLWQAHPTAIEKLLVSMCGYHQQEMTWVQALTKAQRELITKDAFKSPWFWAPYQLIGRWR